jgi:hypothetical protein
VSTQAGLLDEATRELAAVPADDPRAGFARETRRAIERARVEPAAR